MTSSNNIEDSGVRYYPYRITRSQSRQLSQSTSTDLLLPSQPAREKKLYLSSKVIKAAREKLLTFQKVHKVKEEGEEGEEEEKEGYIGSREITLKENVSLNQYHRYLEHNANIPVSIYLHNGNIKAYEVPLSSHAYTAGTIKILMGRWNYRDFDYGDDGDLNLDQDTERKPDCMIKPKHRPRPPAAQAADSEGVPYPTMVVEVGRSQTFPDLHKTAVLYFNARTTTQIVLVIKIFGVRSTTNTTTNITTKSIALIAALYLRTSPTPRIPTSVISFGTANIYPKTVNYILDANSGIGVPPSSFTGVGRPDPNNNNLPFPPCNAANLPAYIMNIPGVQLFDGVPPNLLPQGYAAGFNLDLWELQDTIRRQFNI